MANVRIDQYPKKNSPASTDWLLLQDMSDKDVDGIGKYKKVSPNSVGENTAVGSYTYAQLLALATASELQVGRQYLIEDATSAEFNLLVEAVKANQIGCDAKDPLYPNDVVKYNFASNVITWRWDTVRDVSAGEDWRNSNDLQIPDSCVRITIGSNCQVTLGANCTDVTIGNNSNVILGTSCVNIKIGDNCTNVELGNSSIGVIINDSGQIVNSASSSGVIVYGGVVVTANAQLSNKEFKATVDLTSVSNASIVYNNSGYTQDFEGDTFFIYISSIGATSVTAVLLA